MIKIKEYISRTARTVIEKYLDDISANMSSNVILSHGLKGFKVVDNTTLVTGNFYAIKCISSTSATIDATSVTGDNISGLTILPTDTIFGNFTDVLMTGGTGILLVYYK